MQSFGMGSFLQAFLNGTFFGDLSTLRWLKSSCPRSKLPLTDTERAKLIALNPFSGVWAGGGVQSKTELKKKLDEDGEVERQRSRGTERASGSTQGPDEQWAPLSSSINLVSLYLYGGISRSTKLITSPPSIILTISTILTVIHCELITDLSSFWQFFVIYCVSSRKHITLVCWTLFEDYHGWHLWDTVRIWSIIFLGITRKLPWLICHCQKHNKASKAIAKVEQVLISFWVLEHL